MKFTIKRDLLLEALNNVSRGLSSKTPMPVLTGIKIEVSDKDITLITTNREISVRVVLDQIETLDIVENGITGVTLLKATNLEMIVGLVRDVVLKPNLFSVFPV